MKAHKFRRFLFLATLRDGGMRARDIVLFILVMALFGSGFALYHMNVTVESVLINGTITGMGTATDKYLANDPVLTVKVPNGREVAVLFPADQPLPSPGSSIKLMHNTYRFFGDGFQFAN